MNLFKKNLFLNKENKSHSQLIESEINEFKIDLPKKNFSLEKFQNFYKNQEYLLQQWHYAGGSGKEIAKRRSQVIDTIFDCLFQSTLFSMKATIDDKFCVVAFGGYGREEMSRYSDIDILFLYKGRKISSIYEKVISEILISLWDLGFKIGHATRSIEENIEQANKDMLTKTAMLECRFLLGNVKVFRLYKEKFRKKCLIDHEEYIHWRFENIKKLREKYGKSVFMQEPHIKSGCGGLRDYQNLNWISRIYSEEDPQDYLVNQKFIRLSEWRKLNKNYDFLLRVRNEMHYQEKRANDQLTLLLQGKVATALGYNKGGIIRRSEAFMKDYYEKTREIYFITSTVLERIKTPTKKPGFLRNFLLLQEKVEITDDFLIKGGIIFPKEKPVFKNPLSILKAFHLAQTKSVQFSSELRDVIRRSLLLVDKSFQSSQEAHTIFLSILSHKGQVGHILRLMHDLGFLGKYIPEFGALNCLVQHEFYHLYTADEHTLICIEKIDDLLFTDNEKLIRYSTLFKNLRDPAILYLGMLLHDTGKAANVKSHAKASLIAAEQVAKRFELTPERKNLLKILVEAHGDLAMVARTRDLDDFTTIFHFSKIVKNIPTLDALMIITLADGMGTSDSNWSDWKEKLVWSLYDQTQKYLEVGPIYFEQNRNDFLTKKSAVLRFLPNNYKEEVEAHFEQMPERYLRITEASCIAEHLKLFHSFFEKLNSNNSYCFETQIQWIEHPNTGNTEVWICGWDRNQLLERIAAAFLEAEINILSADIFTRRDHLALDIFRVTSIRSDPLLNSKEKQIMEQCLQEFLKTKKYHLDEKKISRSSSIFKKKSLEIKDSSNEILS